MKAVKTLAKILGVLLAIYTVIGIGVELWRGNSSKTGVLVRPRLP